MAAKKSMPVLPYIDAQEVLAKGVGATPRARLPHEREAAPQEAERYQEDVDALEDHARVGLARPQQALAAEQLTLQAQLGERHLPPRTFRGSSASLNPSPM